MYRRAAVIPGRPPTAEEEGLRQSDSRRVRAPHGRAGRSGPPALASGPIDRRLTPPLMSLKSLRKERRPETPVHSWRLRPLRRTYSCKRPHNRDQGDPAPRRCVVDVGLQRLRKKRGRTGKGDGAGSSGQLRRKWATRALTPTQGTHGGASRGRPAYVEQPRVSASGPCGSPCHKGHPCRFRRTPEREGPGVLAVSELHGRTLPATHKRSRMCRRRQAPASLLLGPGATCAWWAGTWVGCGATGSTDGRVRHTTATAPTTGLSARAFCPEDDLRARPVEGGREGPAGFGAVLSHWGRRTLPLPTVSLRLGGDHNRQ